MGNTSRGFKPYTNDEIKKVQASYDEFRMNGYLSKNGATKSGAIKIGAFYAVIPPSRISVFERSDNQVISTLRQPGNVKLKQARLDTTIQVELVFPDLESINNNFRPILAQFIRAPFVPIENYHLNLLINPSVRWTIDKNITEKENNGIITRTFTDDYINTQNKGVSRAFTEYINNAILKKVDERRKEILKKAEKQKKELEILINQINKESNEEIKKKLQTEYNEKNKEYTEYLNDNVINYDENQLIDEIRKNLDINEDKTESEIYIIAMQNITVNNIPGYSQALQCTLTFNVMTSLPYSNDFSFLKYNTDFIKQNMYYSSRKYLRFPKSWRELNDVHIYKEPKIVTTTTDLSKSEPFIDYLKPLLTGNDVIKKYNKIQQNYNSPIKSNEEEDIQIEAIQIDNISNDKTEIKEYGNLPNHVFNAHIIDNLDGDNIEVDLYPGVQMRMQGYDSFEIKDYGLGETKNIQEQRQLLSKDNNIEATIEDVFEIGRQHKKILTELCPKGKTVKVEVIGTHYSGRPLVKLYDIKNNTCINNEVIKLSKDSSKAKHPVIENNHVNVERLSNIELHFTTAQNWLRMATNDDFNSIDMTLNVIELSAEQNDLLNDLSKMNQNFYEYVTLEFFKNFKIPNEFLKSLSDFWIIFKEDADYIFKTIQLEVTRNLLIENKNVSDTSFENEPFTLSNQYILHDINGNEYKITKNASQTGQWTYNKLLKHFQEFPYFKELMNNIKITYKTYAELQLRAKYGYQTNYHLVIGNSKDTVITGMTASMSHKMAPIWMQLYDYPVFQHMGRNDFAIELNLQTCDAKFLSALRDLSIKYNRNRRVRGKSQDAFFISEMNSIKLPMDIDSNGFFKVLGIGNVIPESIAIQTIPGKPGWMDVNMVLLQNDIDIQKVEKLIWSNEFNQGIVKDATKKLMKDYLCKANKKYGELKSNYPFLTENLFPVLRNFAFKHIASIVYKNINDIPNISSNELILSLDKNTNNYSEVEDFKNINENLYRFPIPYCKSENDIYNLDDYHRINTKEDDNANGNFGKVRNRGERSHRGIDITTMSSKNNKKERYIDQGEKVKANIEGKVITNGYKTDFGNCVFIEKNIQNFKFQFIYAHLAEPSKLKVGTYVKKGDQIGFMGRTGKAYENDDHKTYTTHLHYEVRMKEYKTEIEASKAKVELDNKYSINPLEFKIDKNQLIVYDVNGKEKSYYIDALLKNNNDIIYHQDLTDKLKYILDDIDVEFLYHNLYNNKLIFDIIKCYIYYTYNRNESDTSFITLLKKANDYYDKANGSNFGKIIEYNNLEKYYEYETNFTTFDKDKLVNYVKYCCINSDFGQEILSKTSIEQNVSKTVPYSINLIESTKAIAKKSVSIVNEINNNQQESDFATKDIIPVGKTSNVIQQKYTNANYIFTSLTGALKQAFNLNIPDYYDNIKDSLFRSLILKYIQFASYEFLEWYNNQFNNKEKKITLVDLLAVNQNNENYYVSNYADMELPYITGAYNSTTVDFYFKRFNDTVDFDRIEDKLNIYLDSAKNSWKFNNIKGIYLDHILKTQFDSDYIKYINKIKESKNMNIEFNDDGTTDNESINMLLTFFSQLSNENALPDNNNSEKYIQWLKNTSHLNESSVTQQNLNTYQFLNEFIDIVHIQETYKELNLQAMSENIKNKQNERFNNQLREKLQSLKIILSTPVDKLENIYTPYTMANYYDILNRLKMDYDNYKGRNRERCVESCFPTAKIYFIEEDNKSWQKLDDYYSYDAIEDIKVVKSAKSAADYCEITISNLSEILTNPLAMYRRENVISDNTKDEQQIDSIFLSEGTTIMVKLGYDNNPALLDRVFMGKIVSIEYGDRVQIKAQGFGAELHEPINNGLADRMGFASSMKLHGDLVEYYISTLSSLDHFGARSIFERLGIEDNYVGYPIQDRFNSLKDAAWSSIKSSFFKQYLPVLNLFKTIGTYDPRIENIYLSYSNSESLGFRALNPIENLYNDAKKELEAKGYVKKTIENIFNTMRLVNPMLNTTVYAISKIFSKISIDDRYNYSNILSKLFWNYDFAWVIPDNYSFWDLLSEIKNYYPDYILAVLPYNDWVEGRQRDTIYLGPRKGYYKYTDVFDNSNSSLEFTSHIKAIRDFERDVYNPTERAKFEQEYLEMEEEQVLINSMSDGDEKILKQKEFDKKYRKLNYLLKIICKKSYDLIDSEELHKKYSKNNEFHPDINFYSSVLDRFKVDVVDAEYITEGSVLDSATKSDETSNIKWRINNPDDLLDYDENGNLKEVFPQYQQVQNYYIVNSYSQIISNNITASSEDVYNKVIVTYPKDPTTDIDKHNQQSSYVASDAISPSNIKTKVVHQNNVDPTNFLGNFLGIDSALQYFNANWSTVGELRYAYLSPSVHVGYNILADSIRPMYRGTLELLGMSEIKPYDVIQINDVYNQIDGPIEVEQVIHHYSQNGFTTTIIPNAIVNTKDPSSTKELYLKEGFNIPFFGNVNGANILTLLQNGLGIIESGIMLNQAFQGKGAFNKNSKEVIEKLKNNLTRTQRLEKLKILPKKIKEIEENIRKKENRLNEINEQLKIKNLKKTTRQQLISEQNTINTELKQLKNDLKISQNDLNKLNNVDYQTLLKNNNLTKEEIEILKNIDKSYDDLILLEQKLNGANIRLNELLKSAKQKEDDLNKILDLIKQLKDDITKISLNKFGDTTIVKKFLKNAKIEQQKAIEKLDNTLKRLKEATKIKNNREKEIKAIISEIEGINNSYMAIINSILILKNTIIPLNDITNNIDEFNYESLNNTLSAINCSFSGLALGATAFSYFRKIPNILVKLPMKGLSAWALPIMLLLDILLYWANCALFNWGSGKVEGRNCIYVTPLNLNRAPMLAGLKGYNVYTDIETHINNEIFSFVNAPKEYLAGILTDDTTI